jgi:hypothetical protein
MLRKQKDNFQGDHYKKIKIKRKDDINMHQKKYQ